MQNAILPLGVNGNVAHWAFACTSGVERQVPVCAATIHGGRGEACQWNNSCVFIDFVNV
jgi:hypothetical protein